MTREEQKAKARWEYVSERLCNSDYPIYNEEYELESAFNAGFECAMEYIKEKIEERKQQIFPRKEGAMIVGGPKYEDRLYLNALCWVESLIEENEI